MANPICEICGREEYVGNKGKVGFCFRKDSMGVEDTKCYRLGYERLKEENELWGKGNTSICSAHQIPQMNTCYLCNPALRERDELKETLKRVKENWCPICKVPMDGCLHKAQQDEQDAWEAAQPAPAHLCTECRKVGCCPHYTEPAVKDCDGMECNQLGCNTCGSDAEPYKLPVENALTLVSDTRRELLKKDQCNSCEGQGRIMGPVECPDCHGSGKGPQVQYKLARPSALRDGAGCGPECICMCGFEFIAHSDEGCGQPGKPCNDGPFCSDKTHFIPYWLRK
jgi:hypothetical protein